MMVVLVMSATLDVAVAVTSCSAGGSCDCRCGSCGWLVGWW